MQILVKCPCGSRYELNEEPVNGVLRWPVKCTNCGVDGTATANEYIRKSLSGELEKERQAENVWWKRIFKRREDAGYGTPEAAETVRQPNVLLGAIGALIGGLIGMFCWYFIIKTTGYGVRVVAVGIGILAGFGARLFVPNGNFAMASVAALSALLAIMGGQYLALREEVVQSVDASVKQAYDSTMAYAKAAVTATSDDQIRDLLEEHGASPKRNSKTTALQQRYMLQEGWYFSDLMNDGTAPKFQEVLDSAGEDVSDADVENFRQNELPELKAFVNGDPSRAVFEKSIRNMIVSNFSTHDMMLQTWSPYTLLWLFIGIGGAYKIAYNKSETEDI